MTHKQEGDGGEMISSEEREVLEKFLWHNFSPKDEGEEALVEWFGEFRGTKSCNAWITGMYICELDGKCAGPQPTPFEAIRLTRELLDDVQEWPELIN